jgi:YesN/AraC family two-component response regulator
VSGKADIPFPRGGNEFQQLQQALDRTFSQLDTMAAQLGRQRQLVRSHFVARLLKGRTDPSIPIEESLAAFHMTFASDDFAVLLFYVERSKSFVERLRGMERDVRLKLLQFIFTNVAEELAMQHNTGYVTEMDDSLALLISFKQEGEEERKAELRRIASETQRFLSEAYGIQLTPAISGIHSGAAGIAQAYLETLDAMQYKLVMGSEEILSYEDIYSRAEAEESEIGYYYPLQVEQQLINYMKIGEFEKAKRTFDDIIDHNFGRGTVSVPYARCLMLNLVSTMIKTVIDSGNLEDSFLIRNPKRIELLTQCDTVQEMQREMTDFLQQVCEYMAGKRQSQLQHSRQQAIEELVDRVQAFIQERYQDPNLNISMIGRHFDMKPTYLSKLYKDHTDEGLLDYINKTRIEKAKIIIAEQGKNVSDAAGAVGFNDVNAFIRTFKKYEGITPGKFKEASAEIQA